MNCIACIEIIKCRKSLDEELALLHLIQSKAVIIPYFLFIVFVELGIACILRMNQSLFLLNERAKNKKQQV